MKGLGVFFLGISVLIFSGCATTLKQKDAEVSSLKNQVELLQSQVQQKEAEIDSLRKALSKNTEENYYASKELVEKENISLPTPKEIQTALRNAGYDIEVDGKLGKNTKKAIKDFQKANGLSADGKVGKKTWSALQPYLNKIN